MNELLHKEVQGRTWYRYTQRRIVSFVDLIVHFCAELIWIVLQRNDC